MMARHPLTRVEFRICGRTFQFHLEQLADFRREILYNLLVQ